MCPGVNVEEPKGTSAAIVIGQWLGARSILLFDLFGLL